MSGIEGMVSGEVIPAGVHSGNFMANTQCSALYSACLVVPSIVRAGMITGDTALREGPIMALIESMALMVLTPGRLTGLFLNVEDRRSFKEKHDFLIE